MSNEPVTVETQQSRGQQGISAVEEEQQLQTQQQQQEQYQGNQPIADVGPNMPPQPPQQRSNTGNQIPTDSELEQQQQGNNTEAQANTTNNLGFPVVPKQHMQQQQQQQGVKAPKAKLDFTTTDSTIQGLLIQVGALQHNKIQQIIQHYQEEQE